MYISVPVALRRPKNDKLPDLSQDENIRLIECLSNESIISLSTVNAKVYCDVDSNGNWSNKYNGFLCLAKDYSKHSYFFILYDYEKFFRIWSQEIYTTFDWKNLHDSFYQFQDDTLKFGFYFRDKNEAQKFVTAYKNLIETKLRHANFNPKHSVKFKPNVKISNSDLNTLDQKQLFEVQGKLKKTPSAECKEILSELNMNVALENETKRFFLEFMNRHGGIEKFKTELLKFNRPSMPKFLLPLKGKNKNSIWKKSGLQSPPEKLTKFSSNTKLTSVMISHPTIRKETPCTPKLPKLPPSRPVKPIITTQVLPNSEQKNQKILKPPCPPPPIPIKRPQANQEIIPFLQSDRTIIQTPKKIPPVPLPKPSSTKLSPNPLSSLKTTERTTPQIEKRMKESPPPSYKKLRHVVDGAKAETPKLPSVSPEPQEYKASLQSQVVWSTKNPPKTDFSRAQSPSSASQAPCSPLPNNPLASPITPIVLNNETNLPTQKADSNKILKKKKTTDDDSLSSASSSSSSSQILPRLWSRTPPIALIHPVPQTYKAANLPSSSVSQINPPLSMQVRSPPPPTPISGPPPPPPFSGPLSSPRPPPPPPLLGAFSSGGPPPPPPISGLLLTQPLSTAGLSSKVKKNTVMGGNGIVGPNLRENLINQMQKLRKVTPEQQNIGKNGKSKMEQSLKEQLNKMFLNKKPEPKETDDDKEWQ